MNIACCITRLYGLNLSQGGLKTCSKLIVVFLFYVAVQPHGTGGYSQLEELSYRNPVIVAIYLSDFTPYGPLNDCMQCSALL